MGDHAPFRRDALGALGFLENLAEGWVKLMCDHGAATTVLADDLKVRTGGGEDGVQDEDLVEELHRERVVATLRFFLARGAKLAPGKSLTMGSSPSLRQAMKRAR